jgi:hypothetical protein
VYHSNELSLELLGRCEGVANFAELRKPEVRLRGISLPRTRVNKGVDSSSEHTAPLSNGFLMRSYDSSQHRDIELADKS